MTEVTRVPLQPIAKGSLTKLWLGVIAAIAIGAGLAWGSMPKGISLETLQAGSGPTAQIGDVVFVKYVGKLADGTVFDESKPLPIPPGLMPEGNPFPLEDGVSIPGFFAGLQKVQKDGKYILEIPSDLAYGADPQPGSPIPPNADLTFELEVTEIMSRDDFERRVQTLQQIMQMQQQQQGGAGPGAGPPAGPGQ